MPLQLKTKYYTWLVHKYTFIVSIYISLNTVKLICVPFSLTVTQ